MDEVGFIAIEIMILCGIKKGHELVEILMWDRLIGVIVALDTAEGETLCDGPGGADAVDD